VAFTDPPGAGAGPALVTACSSASYSAAMPALPNTGLDKTW
jgi:hypothetical protein